MMNSLSKPAILSHLRTVSLGRELILLESCASTMTEAFNLAASGAKHGAVVKDGTTILAKTQSAGVGRLNRSFFSPAGHGIYMTILLRPDTISGTTGLTALAAVALCRAIETVSKLTPRVKWVNDILLTDTVGDKKVCGILTQAKTSGSGIAVAVGIGVNVSVPRESFPRPLQDKAASLEDFAPEPIDKNLLAAAVLNEFEKLYIGGFFFEEYRDRLIYMNQWVHLYQNGAYLGKVYIRGLNPDFSLAATDENGQEKNLIAGEISIRKEIEG